eukprot:CAMPEP_0170618648 /NCGR_PEP_ID=MMETSP0224-20130122/27070_1 /TAXON_ID=285029 /ORGANISM="Togula jolla, Strain CCCM 725" /LENGTH=73 /DNA_ID=CAMNT_0010944635 /DNA_START=437 /DNA_END=658 /DNA_ORIENTATION=-
MVSSVSACPVDGAPLQEAFGLLHPVNRTPVIRLLLAGAAIANFTDPLREVVHTAWGNHRAGILHRNRRAEDNY